MGSDGFDDFDGFGSDDSGFDGFDNLGDGFGDLQPSSNHGSENTFDDIASNNDDTFGDFDNNTASNNSTGGGSIDSGNDDGADYSSLQFTDGTSQDNNNDNKKTAKFAIIAGVSIIAVLIIALGIAGRIRSNRNNINNNYTNQQNVQTQQNTNQQVVQQQQNTTQQTPVQNMNVNNIMQQGVPQEQSSSKDGWKEITDKEQVEFNVEPTDLTFTVTGIKHYAKVSDNIVLIETRLTGSLSGVSGTYEIKVPYDKGIKLAIGNEFTVHVQLGNFNGKTVIGEVRY